VAADPRRARGSRCRRRRRSGPRREGRPQARPYHCRR
jgi:hypothetical protein